MRLAVSIQSDVGHRFAARLMTYILMYDLRPDLISCQCIVNRPAARLEHEWYVDISDGVALPINGTQRHAPVIGAVAGQLWNVTRYLKNKINTGMISAK